MTGYLLRRLALSVVVVIGIAAITFALLHLISASPAQAVLGIHASPEAIAAFNKQNGYDRPVPVQFFSYLNQLIHGNLGYSYKLSQSVTALIGQNLGRSAYLSGAALLLAVAVSVPLGILQAARRNRPLDHTATALTFLLYSTPSFFVGLLLIQVFSLGLHWLPFEASQSTSTWGVVLDLRSMIMPILTLSAVQIAGYSRYMRSSALDNLGQDYIGLARAKGLSERQVYARHLLRNSCLPVINLVGMSVPALLSGALLIETLFNYPGLGLLFYHSLQSQDYPVLLALTLMGGVAVVAGNLVADIASTVADPRITL